jgi:hypothetical protein
MAREITQHGSMRETRVKPPRQVPTQAGGKQIVSSTIDKYTTLEQLEKEPRGPVYVINNLKGVYKGMVIVPIARRNGNGQDVVRIPPTFIPVDLTLQVSKDQLLDSSEFRRTVGKKLVVLVNPEYARRLLDTEDGRREAQQVQENMARAKLMVESQIMNGNTNEEASMVNDIDDSEVDSLNMHQSASQEEEDAEEGAPTSVRVKSNRNMTDRQKAQAAQALKNAEEAEEANRPQPRTKFKHTVQSCLDDSKAQTEIVADLKGVRPLTMVEVKYATKYFKSMPRVVRFLEAEKARIKEKAKAA